MCSYKVQMAQSKRMPNQDNVWLIFFFERHTFELNLQRRDVIVNNGISLVVWVDLSGMLW